MKTIKVRIAVAVDPSGYWVASGEKDSLDNSMDIAVDCVDPGEARYWVIAEQFQRKKKLHRSKSGPQLAEQKCIECKAPILVAPYSPHPLEKQATGIPAEMWDSDVDNFRHVGWICNQCAFEIAMSKEGKGMISAGGHTAPTFAYC